MDQTNIAKNKQYGIEAPKDAVTSFGTVFSSVISNKLQQAGPIISIVTSKLGGLSSLGSGSKKEDDYDQGGTTGGSGGGFLGTIGALLGGASSGSKGGADDSNGYNYGTST